MAGGLRDELSPWRAGPLALSRVLTISATSEVERAETKGASCAKPAPRLWLLSLRVRLSMINGKSRVGRGPAAS